MIYVVDELVPDNTELIDNSFDRKVNKWAAIYEIGRCKTYADVPVREAFFEENGEPWIKIAD